MASGMKMATRKASVRAPAPQEDTNSHSRASPEINPVRVTSVSSPAAPIMRIPISAER